MRKLLSIILLLAVAGTVSAQVPMRIDSKTPQHLMVKKSGIKNTEAMKALRARALAKRAITPTSDQMWFGYGNDAEAENMGLALNADYNLAVYIPYEKLAAKGATVDGLRFMLTSTKAKNIKAWVGTKLPPVGKYSQADIYITDVPASSVNVDGYTEVQFPRSIKIPEGGLWIGYSFVIEGMPDAPDDSQVSDEDYTDWYYDVYVPWLMENLNDGYPFMCSYLDEPQEGTMVFGCNLYDDMYRSFAEIDPENAELYLEMVGWDDYSPYGYAVALNALIGGGKFMNNAVSVKDFGQKYAKINETVTFPVTLTNSGKNGIQNFTYEVAINGTKVDEKTITLDKPVENLLGKTTIDLTFPTGDKSGSQNIVVTITKVNGEPNEIEAVANGAIFVLSESAKMKPLIEEYTGTWCGWCTRGWVALDMLTEDFKDDAVIYAVHNGDPMEIDAFVPVVNTYADGFPGMSINRTRIVDPYYGSSGYLDYGVKDDVEASMEDLAPASIAVKASWADDTKTKINFETETKLLYDEENPSISIGYVLVADGLKGTGRDWAQANYYCDMTDVGEDLEKLTEMDEYIIGMEFNHVAVAGWGAEFGVEGSIKGAVKAGEPIQGTYVADLDGLLIGLDRNSDDPDDHVTVLDLIKGKKLHVVAFVVNKLTGQVLNADEVELSNATGITSVSENANSVAGRYNVAGQRINSKQKGINIIRLTNGKNVKVVVK